MNFLQKKIWIVWSKLRFLRLPIEKRVRLEVTTDGRHITFLLVSLYEAGYGVQVVNSPRVFRELTCLRESAPMPFIIGGKERECGISITDKSEFDHRGHREHREVRRIQLDYDYFSGLTSDLQSRVSHGGAAIAEVSGKQGNHETHEITRNEEAGLRLVSQAGAAFSNPSTSELARDSENISLTRSASGPASALRADEDRRSEIVVGAIRRDGGNQLADAGYSRSEWSGAFEGPSSSSLVCGSAKTLPAQASGVPASDSSFRVVREFRGEKSEESEQLPCPASLPEALRMPYFMHPSVYHRCLHKRRSRSTSLETRYPLPVTSYSPQRRRRFRIGFFGTHDREFYTAHYHFPGMNRFEILEVFLKRFGDRLAQVSGAPEYWSDSEIVVALDERGGDRRGKSFLSQDHYFEALRECDFVLSPPGWCMPVSHNLVEAMFCGAIPITNAGAFMAEPLEDGRDCLGFFGEADLVTAIEKALSMSDQEIEKMRGAVWKFYDKTLNPRVFGGIICEARVDRVLVNAEEKSVSWGRELESGVGEFMAKFC
jgi:hypothetical protein